MDGRLLSTGRSPMPGERLGRTLIIANPAANCGEAQRAADRLESILQDDHRDYTTLDFRLTSKAGDGELFASQASAYDTLLVVGGDGIMHEVVNGLMRLDTDERPRVGLIPMGSGNDYARTLGMPRNDVEGALREILSGVETPVELGQVNGTYFMQTLSFGLDAAIALDTTDRRAADTTQRGSRLFVSSGIRIMSTYSDGWSYTATLDDHEHISGREIIFAVQVGPTYGGGFKVCPKADPRDGLLDVCHNAEIPPKAAALCLFGLARFGAHTGAKAIRTRQVKHITLDFAEEPPCQVDGEKLVGTHFEIDVVPRAIRVLCKKA